jgi:hypothetical protein
MFNYFLCRISRSVLFITGNEIMISNFLLQIKEKICNRNLLQVNIFTIKIFSTENMTCIWVQTLHICGIQIISLTILILDNMNFNLFLVLLIQKHVMFSVENILIVKMFTWSVYLEFNNIELDVITLLSSYISISIKQMFNYFLCRM